MDSVDDVGSAPIGHVISVAGSEILALLEPRAAQNAEVGRVVRLEGRQGRSFGVVTTLRRDSRGRASDDKRFAGIRLVGEILNGVPEAFQRGVSSFPALDSPIHAATPGELSTMYARPDAATVRLGTLHQASEIDAFALTDNLLGKHFAVLGTTGAGKSCAMTLILQAILDAHPCGHIVMIDPHNEYGQAFAGRAELLNPGNLKLPYWLLTFDELAQVLVSQDTPERAYAEKAILRRALSAVKSAAAGGDTQVTIDSPIPYRLSELVRVIREDMGAFNRADSTAPFQHLLDRVEAVGNDRRFGFMFSSFLIQDNMREVLGQILRIPVEGKPLTIIDISGVPSEIVDVVVSVLFRLVFEFALWSDRAKAPPLLLVCEEAHRYVPKDAGAGFAPTRRSIARIAKEGRKYGLGLCLVTQRPSELALDSLTQCNTIFALRLGNERDLEFVRGAVPDGSRWLVDSLPALNTREAIIIGDGVSVPMHIRFDELPPERRPASTTPSFASRWQQDGSGADLLDDTIRRWRQQIRSSDLAAASADPPAAPDQGAGSPKAVEAKVSRPDDAGGPTAPAGFSIRKPDAAPAAPPTATAAAAAAPVPAPTAVEAPPAARPVVAPAPPAAVHAPSAPLPEAAPQRVPHLAADPAPEPNEPGPARFSGSSLRRRFGGRFA
ncbi:MAG TPA: ATP-binding protein [Geminicoccaceae bacterium]